MNTAYDATVVPETWTTLQTECSACRKCKIGGIMVEGKFLSNVLSNMNTTAKIMVVGQNPGREEVERKEPFVGEAGRRFDAAVKDILGMSRSDFYICNTVRCFTPGNRKPFDNEVENCQPFLDWEIKLVQPKIIVALGAVAFKQLTGMSGVMKHHGQVFTSLRYRVLVMPIIHPSPLNTNNPERREAFYSDLRKLKEFLDGPRF
jgi:DNA polymerase